MKFSQTKTLDFPAADTTLGAAFIQISRRVEPEHLSIAWNGALPTAGAVEVLVLKDGGEVATAADYVLLASLTAPGTIRVAKPRGIRVYGFSGTGTGNVDVTVIAD